MAYAACVRLARAHYENFPVASWALPAAMRRHVAAVYAFARVADDFADERSRPVAERHRLLDAWEARLVALAEDRDPAWAPRPGEPREAPLIFRAVAHSMTACDLPVSLFADLLSAFRQDTSVTRYVSWDSLLDYCRRSANPVGRLVLRIAGVRDDTIDRRSDAVCTALQLTNFWQDFAADWHAGRLYLPLDVVSACGARTQDLDRGVLTDAWRAAVREAVVVTRRGFDEGREVCDAVSGRLRYELRLTWLGGTRVLDRIERAGFDVLARRPVLGAADAPGLAWRALAWSRT